MTRVIIPGVIVAALVAGMGVVGYSLMGMGHPAAWAGAVLGVVLATVLAANEGSPRVIAFMRLFGRRIYLALLVVTLGCLCLAVYENPSLVDCSAPCSVDSSPGTLP